MMAMEDSTGWVLFVKQKIYTNSVSHRITLYRGSNEAQIICVHPKEMHLFFVEIDNKK